MWPFRSKKSVQTAQLANKNQTKSTVGKVKSDLISGEVTPEALAIVMGKGVEVLANATHTYFDSNTARQDLDSLIQGLPYQIPPDLYTQMATEPYPTLEPLYLRLGQLGKADTLSNFHYLFQHYVEVLNRYAQFAEIKKLLQDFFADLKPTISQELLINFLDAIPSGFLDEERGSLMGREELLRVLEELRSEKDKVEAARVRDAALLTSIGDGVVAIDGEHHIIFINDSAKQMLGLQTADIERKDWFKLVSLVTEKDQPVALEERPMYQALAKGERITNSTFSFLKKDQTRLPISLTATPFILHDKTSGAVLVFKDVTAEREIDHQKTEFISVASHQLRTPLGSMKWNLEMLVKGYYGEIAAESKKIISDTLESNNRLIALVNELLNISRIEQRRVQDHPTKTDVPELIAATIKEVQPLADARKVTLEVTGEKNLPPLCIDAGRLREVIENIVSNAVKYNAEGGTVSINLSLETKTMTVEVADEGMGIPEAEQNRVFSRFFRAENAIKNEPNGSGFGLFVVKSYMEGWGGKVWFESPTLPDNRGTTFFLQLPLEPKGEVQCELTDKSEAEEVAAESPSNQPDKSVVPAADNPTSNAEPESKKHE